MNLWVHFSLFGERRRSARSQAALSAFLWRIFSPGAAAAATGGVLVLVLGVAQVMLVGQQNAKLDQQTHIMQAQTNVALLSQMGPVLERIMEFAEKTCLDPKVAAEFGKPGISPQPKEFGVDGQRPHNGLPLCWIDVQPETRQLWILACSSDEECLQTARKGASRFRSIAERRASLDEEPMEWTLQLPAGLHGQVISLSQSARPYRFIDTSEAVVTPRDVPEKGVGAIAGWWLSTVGSDQPRLVNRPLSPERGTLLSVLVRLGFQLSTESLGRPDYSSAHVDHLEARGFVSNISFSKVSLPGAQFPQAKFGFTALVESDVPCGDFSGAELHNASVRGGDFSGAYFGQAFLPHNDNFSPANLSGAYLEGAIVREQAFLSELATRGVKGFDPSIYRLVEDDRYKGAYRIIFRPGLDAQAAMGQSQCSERRVTR